MVERLEKTKARSRRKVKELIANRKARGLCFRCGMAPPVPGRPMCRSCLDRTWQKFVVKKLEVKSIVLAHYGPDGLMQCSWSGCFVDDPDMLTLDHVNDDGAIRRKNGEETGHKLRIWLLRHGFPSDFQTLCWNHQMKKRCLRSQLSHCTSLGYDVYGEDNKPHCSKLNLDGPMTIVAAKNLKKNSELAGWKNISIVTSPWCPPQGCSS